MQNEHYLTNAGVCCKTKYVADTHVITVAVTQKISFQAFVVLRELTTHLFSYE